MPRRKLFVGVAAVLLVATGLVALASVTGVPPGGRVRTELFEWPAGGSPVGDPADAGRVDDVVESDPRHWGGSFAEGDHLVVTFVDVDEATARRALIDAGVNDAVRLEPRTISRADADEVRDRIRETGLMGTRIMGLGFDPVRSVVEVEARRPDLGLVELLEEATARSDVPVRIHWLQGEPSAR